MIEGKEVIFVLGGPGSGKGTQATRIAEEFNFGYAAAGDLLRKEANTPGSPNGQRIAEIINSGNLVPPELLVETLKNAIRAAPQKYFLLDGFPRSLIQDQAFREQAGMCKSCFMLDCPDDVLIARLTKRAEQSGRVDDDPTVIPRRIQTYYNETAPVLNHYEEEGLLVRINGNQPVETVHEEFVAKLRQFWTF